MEFKETFTLLMQARRLVTPCKQPRKTAFRAVCSVVLLFAVETNCLESPAKGSSST